MIKYSGGKCKTVVISLQGQTRWERESERTVNAIVICIAKVRISICRDKMMRTENLNIDGSTYGERPE